MSALPATLPGSHRAVPQAASEENGHSNGNAPWVEDTPIPPDPSALPATDNIVGHLKSLQSATTIYGTDTSITLSGELPFLLWMSATTLLIYARPASHANLHEPRSYRGSAATLLPFRRSRADSRCEEDGDSLKRR